MKNYKSKYGTIQGSNLILYPLDYQTISLSTIAEIKINEKEKTLNYFFNYLRIKEYDFTIVLDDQKEVKFTFSKRNLDKVIAFKKRILHLKFCSL
ncbi:hypothetical protein [Flavobacterium sp.]|uniref:hypothetical protein n=1 Tax=Flavobacterium sp. TaxID=239 RepID=UPI002FD9A410